MSSTSPSKPFEHQSAEVSERIRSLQLGSAERKTSEFGFRKWRWLAILALVIAGVWWFNQGQPAAGTNWQRWLPTGSEPRQTAPVRVEGGEQILLDLTGYIVPKHKVSVSPRVPGLLVEVNFEEGHRVEANQVLARLDEESFQADYDQAAAALLAAESRLLEMKNGLLPEELDQARTAVGQAQEKLKLLLKDLGRMAKLRADVTEAEWDHLVSAKTDAEANLSVLQRKLELMEKPHRAERLQAAEAEVESARAVLARAQTALNHATLRAPFSGVVLERKAEVGENVRPDAMATGLCVLADMSELEVRVDVEEQSLGKLHPGQPCRIIPDAFPDKTYEAKVSRWQLQVNRARAVVQVILSINEPDGQLLSEMNCRAIILDAAQANEPETLWIPASAVVQDGDDAVVYVVDQKTARRRPVKLGTTRESEVQISDGLSKTDVVVLPGNKPLADGESVR